MKLFKQINNFLYYLGAKIWLWWQEYTELVEKLQGQQKITSKEVNQLNDLGKGKKHGYEDP